MCAVCAVLCCAVLCCAPSSFCLYSNVQCVGGALAVPVPLSFAQRLSIRDPTRPPVWSVLSFFAREPTQAFVSGPLGLQELRSPTRSCRDAGGDALSMFDQFDDPRTDEQPQVANLPETALFGQPVSAECFRI